VKTQNESIPSSRTADEGGEYEEGEVKGQNVGLRAFVLSGKKGDDNRSK